MPVEPIERKARVRFAIVGCGAVTRLYAAPALARLSQRGLARVSRVFDPDPGAIDAVSSLLPSAEPAADLVTALEAADVALIASPPSLHREQTVQALRCGLHVFCEKPMALTAADADEIVSTAKVWSRLVTVGLIRRHLPATRAIKALLAAKILGRLRSIAWFEGGPFAWPASSPRYFSKEISGGGVLQDIGTHALDLLAWWCGPLTVVDYADDAMGGVEANASLRLRAGEADVRLRLSRDWERPNLATIRGESRHRRMGHQRTASVQAVPRRRRVLGASPGRRRRGTDGFRLRLRSAARGSRRGHPDGRRTGRSGDRRAGRLRPGGAMLSRPSPARDALVLGAGARPSPACGRRGMSPTVAVLGAGGFIGNRLVETLHLRGEHRVRPVVRRAASLALSARFSLDCRLADARDEAALIGAFPAAPMSCTRSRGRRTRWLAPSHRFIARRPHPGSAASSI